MELKSYGAQRTAAALRGSNRTFMELKFRTGKYIVRFRCVLIVPLWN